ncbi:hypothetical protein H6F62_15075 [Anabaena sp. FACHB-1391]|uniref:hypothetical protein n=1 Tax=Anabaena sp. FACHB-1391 TaxID=2692771 RepID=UPI001680F5E5|nr:hypothetical protein [Anabaena sp. FACHB-1391]MBD2270043.1 hypothetical protein [Anabaena sp. FACHB-1391]
MKIKLEYCPFGDIGNKEITLASVEVETEHNDLFEFINPVVKVQSYPTASNQKNKLKAAAEKASARKDIEEMALRAWNREIEVSIGYQGHSYSPNNLDLSHAVYGLPSFKVLSIEGNEDFQSKLPRIPKGCVS